MREKSPAHHIRDLYLEIGQDARIPDEFFECMPWFTDLGRITFSGHGGVPLGYGGHSSSPEPSSWKLPKSVTSLTICTKVVTLLQVRDIMAQLPNLDDLALSVFAEAEGGKLRGIGTVLKGRFGGRLVLSSKCVGEEVINVLFEIPSGLRFAELELHCSTNPLPSSVARLAEACGKTLVKLSHTVFFFGGSYPFSGWFWREILTRTPFSTDTNLRHTLERSFDFSKFPNVQDVTFCFWDSFVDGGVPWIPMALSTLRAATSPRLSVIRLDFHSSTSKPPEPTIIDSDLRRIADEVARIQREFEGAVKFTVLRDAGFQVGLDAFNVRFGFVGRKKPRSYADSSSFVSCRSFNITFVEMGQLSLHAGLAA